MSHAGTWAKKNTIVEQVSHVTIRVLNYSDVRPTTDPTCLKNWHGNTLPRLRTRTKWDSQTWLSVHSATKRQTNVLMRHRHKRSQGRTEPIPRHFNQPMPSSHECNPLNVTTPQPKTHRSLLMIPNQPSAQRLQTAELEWILDNMRRGEYQTARRTETALHSTSFLTNPIGGIDGVSHAMIETTYRPSPTNRNTSTHKSKGGRLLGFLLRQLPLSSLPVGPLFFGGAPLLLHALGSRARLACSAPPIQIRDALTISEERTSSVHTPALGATFDFLIPGPQTSRNDTRTHADPSDPKPGGLATQTLPYRSENENG